MTTMLERLRGAMNGCDIQRLASLFATDYRSVQPQHPGRGLDGSSPVLANRSSVFAGVPDLSSELVASAVQGDNEWGEWDWRGHHLDGSPFSMRGEDIATAVQQLSKPPPPSSDQRWWAMRDLGRVLAHLSDQPFGVGTSDRSMCGRW